MEKLTPLLSLRPIFGSEDKSVSLPSLRKSTVNGRFAALVILGVGFAGFVGGSGAWTVPAPKAKNPIKIQADLGKHSAVIDEKIHYEQTVPANSNAKFKFLENRVVRIGRWDAASGVMTNLTLEKCQEEHNVFADLPPFKGWSGVPRPFGEVRPGRIGKIYEIIPKRIGVFMIYTEWEVPGEDTRWQSPPVVISVYPPTDAFSKLVIKPEYLVEEPASKE